MVGATIHDGVSCWALAQPHTHVGYDSILHRVTVDWQPGMCVRTKKRGPDPLKVTQREVPGRSISVTSPLRRGRVLPSLRRPLLPLLGAVCVCSAFRTLASSSAAPVFSSHSAAVSSRAGFLGVRPEQPCRPDTQKGPRWFDAPRCHLGTPGWCGTREPSYLFYSRRHVL